MTSITWSASGRWIASLDGCQIPISETPATFPECVMPKVISRKP
jgi:hypothetical protein